ncbi:MAG: hypothetical protein ACRD0J_13795, partial [Acidimicrobiales bacterium]
MITTPRTYRRIIDVAVAVVTGRRSKWAVLVGAIVAVALVGPLAGKLPSLENNSPNSFLPSGAASTEVLHYEEAHAGAASTPAVVVYERAGGLRPGDRSTIARASAAVAGEHIPGASAPGPLRVSKNGRAASFSLPIVATTSQKVLTADVKAVRAEVAKTAVPATTSPA